MPQLHAGCFALVMPQPHAGCFALVMPQPRRGKGIHLSSLFLQFFRQVAYAHDADFELVAGQVLRGLDEVADALALDVAAHEKNLELACYFVRNGALRGALHHPGTMRTKR